MPNKLDLLKPISLCAAVVFVPIIMIGPVDAQPVSITGTVIDSASSAAIGGASVRLIEDPSAITITAANGTFTLSSLMTHAGYLAERLFPTENVSLCGNKVTITGLNGRAPVSVEVFTSSGIRVQNRSGQTKLDGTIAFAQLWRSPGLYFVKIRTDGREFILSNAGTPRSAGRLISSGVHSSGRLGKVLATYTLEISAPGYRGRQVVSPAAKASVGTIRLLKHAGSYYWTQTTAGTGRGMARYGYCGAWDQNPAAIPGQFMFAQSDNDAHTGFAANDATYGVLGQTRAIDSVYKYRTSGGSWKTVACQDSRTFDLHIVSNGPQVGTGWGTYSLAYARLRPVRDNTGKISGWTKDADLYLATMPGGTTNAWLGSNFNIWEAVDGTGAKRLMMLIQRDRQLTPDSSNNNVVDDCLIGVSSVAAGTTPDAGDWVGLDNVSKDPTYVGTIRNLPNNDAYWIDSYVACHAISKKVEVFMGQGAHGVGGEHNRVVLTPIAGTGAWSATDGVAGVATPHGTGEHYLSSYSNVAGFGEVAAAGIDDDVWWIWDDGIVTRISRVKKDGTVDWNPLPSLGTRMSWNAPRGFSVSPDGAVGLIDIEVQDNSPIRGRICRGSVWSSWIDMGILNNPNYYQNPVQGLARVNGEYWFGVVSIPMNGTMEPTIAALSFAAP